MVARNGANNYGELRAVVEAAVDRLKNGLRELNLTSVFVETRKNISSIMGVGIRAVHLFSLDVDAAVDKWLPDRPVPPTPTPPPSPGEVAGIVIGSILALAVCGMASLAALLGLKRSSRLRAERVAKEQREKLGPNGRPSIRPPGSRVHSVVGAPTSPRQRLQAVGASLRKLLTMRRNPAPPLGATEGGGGAAAGDGRPALPSVEDGTVRLYRNPQLAAALSAGGGPPSARRGSVRVLSPTGGAATGALSPWGGSSGRYDGFVPQGGSSGGAAQGAATVAPAQGAMEAYRLYHTAAAAAAVGSVVGPGGVQPARRRPQPPASRVLAASAHSPGSRSFYASAAHAAGTGGGVPEQHQQPAPALDQEAVEQLLLNAPMSPWAAAPPAASADALAGGLPSSRGSSNPMHVDALAGLKARAAAAAAAAAAAGGGRKPVAGANGPGGGGAGSRPSLMRQASNNGGSFAFPPTTG